MGICKYCGGNTYVEAPPFERMSDEDKDNWQRNGGRVMEICRDCGNEQDTTKPKKKDGTLDKIDLELIGPSELGLNTLHNRFMMAGRLSRVEACKISSQWWMELKERMRKEAD